MTMDMHVHTTASDGADSPACVVAVARRIGLSAIAITDHDTLAGIAPAIAAGHLYGVKVISGIELSTEYGQLEVHILGYLLEKAGSIFTDKLAMFRRYRLKRIEQMVSKLQSLGLPIKLTQVLDIAGEGAAGRPHLAVAMVEAGIVFDIEEAFAKYIGKECVAYVPRYKITPEEAIRLIRQARGIPVLAHPGLGKAGELIQELSKAGLSGIEAFHPAHSREIAEYYSRVGKEYNLIITGGSDYHGLERKHGRNLGMVTVPDSVLWEMEERQAVDYF